MAITSDYEIYDMLNRMSRAMDFIKEKNEIKELLDQVTIIQQYLQRFGSLGELMKHMKDIENHIYVCKEMFTPEEAAKYLGISLSHMYRLTSNNEITKYKPTGKLMYISKAELNQWMKQNEILSDQELEKRGREKAEDYQKERNNKRLNRK